MRRLPRLVLIVSLLVGCSARKPNPVDAPAGAGTAVDLPSACPAGRKPSGIGSCVVDFGGRCRLDGVAFSPYMQGQSPLTGTVIPAAQIQARLELIADATRRIRTYGARGGLESSCAVARELGLGFDQGIWLGSDHAANENEIAAFVDIAGTCQMDTVIVGNEAVWRKDLAPAELIELIARVRGLAPAGARLTTAEVWKTWTEQPKLVEAVDVLYMHAYPYWGGIPIDSAIQDLEEAWRQVIAVAGGKPVVIAETGWPSAGQPKGEAVPSHENAARYLSNFVRWAHSMGVGYFYFSAFDEDWKLADADGSVGASWGILDRDGVPKTGMRGLMTEGCEP